MVDRLHQLKIPVTVNYRPTGTHSWDTGKTTCTTWPKIGATSSDQQSLTTQDKQGAPTHSGGCTPLRIYPLWCGSCSQLTMRRPRWAGFQTAAEPQCGIIDSPGTGFTASCPRPGAQCMSAAANEEPSDMP